MDVISSYKPTMQPVVYSEPPPISKSYGHEAFTTCKALYGVMVLDTQIEPCGGKQKQ